MSDNQLTSSLVYNYMKERSIVNATSFKKNNQKRLDIKMEYQQYIPEKSSFFSKSVEKNNSRQGTKRNDPIKRISQLKKAYDKILQNSVSLPFESYLIKPKLFTQSQKNVFVLSQSKKQKISLKQIPNLVYRPQKKIFNNYSNFKQQKKRKKKKNFRIKAGLEINSVKFLNLECEDNQIQKPINLDSGINNSNITLNKTLKTQKAEPLRQKDQQVQKIQQKSAPKENQRNIITKVKISNLRGKIFSMKKNKQRQWEEDERSLESRLSKMFNFLSLCLYSYGYFVKIQQKFQEMSLTGKKKMYRYLYYVGQGNNKNLIVSILKKRWWWAKTQDIGSANLVWTQLKVQSILKNQTHCQIQEAKKQIEEKAFTDKVKDNAIYRLFHQKMNGKFHKKMKYQQQVKYLRQLTVPNTIHNHFQCNFMLGNKKALFHNLFNYYLYQKKSVFEIIPITFHIQKINSKNWKLFEKEYRASKNNLWIIKPGENSNRGKGIFVQKEITKIIKKVQSPKKQGATYIIQKYIKNLFLFQNRKFDIRTYMLMVSIGGVIKYFWYNEGYLRTSSQIFDPQEIDDIYIHLTNDAVQVKSDKYGKYEQGNKISYHQFQRYLDNNYFHKKYSVQDLNLKMKQIACETAKATYFQLNPSKPLIGFQLFGLDFLIDSSFRPWLLQVNTNPCLQLSSGCLERLIPRMIQNVFRIALDPVFQPTSQCPRSLSFYIPENMMQYNRFQLMFDSLYDSDKEWQCFSNSLAKIQYEDEDEEFEGDGDFIIIDN